jgi:hypothetical protein
MCLVTAAGVVVAVAAADKTSQPDHFPQFA